MLDMSVASVADEVKPLSQNKEHQALLGFKF